MKKLNYAVIPSYLLELKKTGVLTANNIAILAYLLSIYNPKHSGIQVSQKKIKEAVGLESEEAVSANIYKLYKLGFINEVFVDTFKPCKLTKSTVYILNREAMQFNKGVFYIPRNIFKKRLSPKELLVYFFLSHAQDHKAKKSWNSYSDIARRLKIQRSEVMEIIKNLADLKIISKTRHIVKITKNGIEFGENRYCVLWLAEFAKEFFEKYSSVFIPKRKKPSDAQIRAWENYKAMKEWEFMRFARAKIDSQLAGFKAKYRHSYRMTMAEYCEYIAICGR